MGRNPSAAPDREIQSIRRRIDALDRSLLDLLNERIECARRIGAAKAATGAPTYVPPREKQVLSRLLDKNPGPFPNDTLIRIYREIFSASRRAESRLRAAYPGSSGSLGHAAAHAVFGSSSSLVGVPGPAAGMAEVARDAADYAVLPALTAPEGVGSHALVELLRYELHLVAELFLPLEVSIAARPGRKAITRVLVPPAFADLGVDRVASELPRARVEAAADIAAAGREAAGSPGTGALVPPFTAEVFGLTPRFPVLGPAEGRSVRFLVAGRQSPPPSGSDKTTLALSLVNRAGNLTRALAPFSKRKINLDLLTAAPAGASSREDLFFLDFDGHMDAAPVRKAIAEMRRLCSFVEVLGSYPVFAMHTRTRA